MPRWWFNIGLLLLPVAYVSFFLRISHVVFPVVLVWLLTSAMWFIRAAFMALPGGKEK